MYNKNVLTTHICNATDVHSFLKLFMLKQGNIPCTLNQFFFVRHLSLNKNSTIHLGRIKCPVRYSDKPNLNPHCIHIVIFATNMNCRDVQRKGFKHCREVKFNDIMTIWPVQKQTNRTTQNAQNNKA